MKRLVFILMKIPFFKRLVGISRLIVEVLNDQNLLQNRNWLFGFRVMSNFCSSGHFSERDETACQCGKSNSP